jgi:glycosyltransferase involved in cell wall biosynthesis
MMPAYNAELFIAEAIESVLNQDYLNSQLVICDDASTDNTAQIILDYQCRFPETILAIINEKNIGVTNNCNLALEHCDGEFIALFAGDDVMLPGKISAQVAIMLENPDAVLCYHPVEIFESSTNKTLFISDQNSKKNILSYKDILLRGGIAGGCSIMIRRDAMPQSKYDVRLKTVSDWLFFIEVAMKGRIVKLEQTFARYRKHVNGLSQQSFNLLDESLYALDLLLEKHQQNLMLPNLVSKAKARYLAGEAFRQLTENKTRAFALAKQGLNLHPSNIHLIILYGCAWLNYYIPAIGLVINFVLKYSWSKLKKKL